MRHKRHSRLKYSRELPHPTNHHLRNRAPSCPTKFSAPAHRPTSHHPP
ncbi:hypothetical protein OROGR_014865 [Orobanche gracilis]